MHRNSNYGGMPATVITLLKYVHRFHRTLKNVTRFYQCNSHVCSYTDNVIAEEILLSLITPRTLSQRERVAEVEGIFYLRH